MKVAVVAPSAVPFVRGGAERMCEGLVGAFNERTPHVAELVRVPAPEGDLGQILDGYELFAGLDLSHFDLLISCKYPAWMVEHPDHVVWMQHPQRNLYELYRADLPTEIPDDVPELEPVRRLLARAPRRSLAGDLIAAVRDAISALGQEDAAVRYPGPVARSVVQWLDRMALDPGQVKRHLTISGTVARRPGYFPSGINATVLIPPSSLEGLREGRFEYLFTASRLESLKRLDLLIEAMRYVPGDVHLKIAGTGNKHHALVEQAGADPRIEFLGAVSEQSLAGLYADALAVPFVPYDEDLGLITLESYESGKPVVTCRDSGGPAEVVLDGQTGYVTEPTAEAVGVALRRLAGDHGLAKRMGKVARQRGRRFTWDHAIDVLLSRSQVTPPPIAFPRARRRVALVSASPMSNTYSAERWDQLRVFGFARGLEPEFDVEVVCPSETDGAASRQLGDGVGLHTVSIAGEQRHRSPSGSCLTRASLAVGAEALPRFAEAIERAARHASLLVVFEPELAPLAKRLAGDAPVVVDVASLDRHPADRQGSTGATAIPRPTWLEQASAVTVPTARARDRVLSQAGASLPVLVVPQGADPAQGEVAASTRRSFLRTLANVTGAREPGDLRAVLVDFECDEERQTLDTVVVEIARTRPHTAFVVVGHPLLPAGSLPSNLVVVGRSPRAHFSALLAAVDVVLVPRTLACGPGQSVLDALANGVPVLTTPEAVECLDLEGQPGVSPAPIDRLGAAFDQLLGRLDPEREAARSTGRRLALERAWPAVTQPLRNTATSLVTSPDHARWPWRFPAGNAVPAS